MVDTRATLAFPPNKAVDPAVRAAPLRSAAFGPKKLRACPACGAALRETERELSLGAG